MEPELQFPSTNIIVLSEHAGMFRAIEVCLRQRLNLKAEWVEVATGAKSPVEIQGEQPDLIVVIDLSPKLQPLVTLARTGLCGRLRQTPVLVISGYPFQSDSELKLYHLDLPFTPEGLCRLVQTALQTRPTPDRLEGNRLHFAAQKAAGDLRP